MLSEDPTESEPEEEKSPGASLRSRGCVKLQQTRSHWTTELNSSLESDSAKVFCQQTNRSASCSIPGLNLNTELKTHEFFQQEVYINGWLRISLLHFSTTVPQNSKLKHGSRMVVCCWCIRVTGPVYWAVAKTHCLNKWNWREKNIPTVMTASKHN